MSSSFHRSTGNLFFFQETNQINLWSLNPTVTQQQEANFQPRHTVTPLAEELRLFLLRQSWQQCTSFLFCFLSLQPKGFRRYYSSPLLIHEQFGCIKEVMPIGRFWLLFCSVSLWQCSATDFQPWYLPSAAFQLLSVTECPSAISGKDHFKDTKLEEERVCLLCISLKTLYIKPFRNHPFYNNNYLISR